MSLAHSAETSLITPACYLPETRVALVLQRVQIGLAATHPRATLRDAAHLIHRLPTTYGAYAGLIRQLQAEHGEMAELEDIIQEFVARQLAHQLAQRLAKKAEVVA